MKFIKKLPVFLAFAFLGIPNHSFAQYHYDTEPFFSYFKDLKRWDFAGGVVLPTGTFNGVSHVRGSLAILLRKENLPAKPASVGLSAFLLHLRAPAISAIGVWM